jgi:hypothetical protein
MSKHTPMVVAAARELCARESEECGVDNDDNWKMYGETFLMDAKAALDAAGVPQLLEALRNFISDVQPWTDSERIAIARAAIKAAEGA